MGVITVGALAAKPTKKRNPGKGKTVEPVEPVEVEPAEIEETEAEAEPAKAEQE